MNTNTHFRLRQIYGTTYGPGLKDYRTLAGAKSGLRMLKRDLLRKRIPWGSDAKCFESLSTSLRKSIAKQLGITKHINTVEIVR